MRFSYLRGYRCVSCGREYEAGGPVRTSQGPAGEGPVSDGAFDQGPSGERAVYRRPVCPGPVYTCRDCGPIRGTLDAVYDLEGLRKVWRASLLQGRGEATLWRYHELLPVRKPEAPLDLPVGMTPLYKLDRELGFPLPRVWIKDDTRHPSGSAKDRATAVAVAHARECGAAAVAAASTGNAASSLATFAARAGLPAHIFVPRAAPPAKLVQIQAHGANLYAVEGTYDQAFDLCAALCDRTGLYNRNTATNPVLGEGKKTLALEIWEQLGYRLPGAVVVPAGDGCIIGGVYKGFRDLSDLGCIARVPRLIGAQARGSSALARAWREGRDSCEPVDARTVADSLSVSLPRDQVKALRAVRESSGCFVTVGDEAILEALSLLASRTGILVEPAAAAALAGLRQAVTEGRIAPDEEVVLVLTGHGLKDIDSARRASSWNAPVTVAPDVDAVERVVAGRMKRRGAGTGGATSR